MLALDSTKFYTKYGTLNVTFHDNNDYQCVSFSLGNICTDTPIIRLHSACLFGEVFHSKECDCGQQIAQALEAIAENGCGIIVYSYQEGRGAGLQNKIKAMDIQNKTGCNTSEAFSKLNLKVDFRDYRAEIKALIDLKVNKNIITFEGNKQKIESLKKAGFNIIKLLEFNDNDLSEHAKVGKESRANCLKHIY